MSEIKTFSQALPILAEHQMEPRPIGGRLWVVGAQTLDKAGVVRLARELSEGPGPQSKPFEQEPTLQALDRATRENDTQALAVAERVAVGVPMMDQAEARGIVNRIKARIEDARRDLLELNDREGWKALGYSSWGACAKAEFGHSAATLYRQLEAAQIERDVRGDSQVENPIPTAQLQAVKQLAPEQRKEAFQRADQIAGDKPRTAQHVQQAAQEVAPAQPFWQSMSPNHPTAHLWTRTGMNEHHAACGMVTQRAPSGATSAGHCSSCVRAAWGEKQTRPDPDFASVVARWDALGYRLLPDLAGPGNDRYRLLPPDGRVGIANMQWHDVLARLEIQERKASDAAAAPAQLPAHLTTCIRCGETRSERRLLTSYEAGLVPEYPGRAVTLCSRCIPELLAERAKVAPSPSDQVERIADGARRRAIGLLKQLAPLLELIKTEDFEGLSMAIANLNECQEGTEARHWLDVGWALLDCEPEHVPTLESEGIA